MNKHRVMVVDDEIVNCEIMELHLQDEYELSIFESGQACLAEIENVMPDVVLLDVSMPGMDGYEVCKQIKANENISAIPVIFVSARSTNEERLAGFEAGGDDYISKPFNAKELKVKLSLTLSNQSKNRELEENSKMAMKTAMSAMATSSELGIIVQFIENSSKTTTQEDLAQTVIDACQEYGLNVVVQIRADKTEYNISGSNYVSQLEEKLFNQLMDMGRIIEFNQRCVVNYPALSLFIKNMPIDNLDLTGRLKDHLCVIVQAANNRVAQIIVMDEHQERQDLRALNLQRMALELKNLTSIFENYVYQSNQICVEQLILIEEALPSMGLEEDQESRIINILENSNNKIIAHLKNKTELEKSVNSLMNLSTS